MGRFGHQVDLTDLRYTRALVDIFNDDIVDGWGATKLGMVNRRLLLRLRRNNELYSHRN